MNSPVKLARRNFLLGIAAGASATVAIATRHTQTTVPQTLAKEESGRGYQLTAHVRNYYRTTKV